MSLSNESEIETPALPFPKAAIPFPIVFPERRTPDGFDEETRTPPLSFPVMLLSEIVVASPSAT